MKRGNYAGISQHYSEELLKKYGHNDIKNISETSALKILLHQIRTNYVIYLMAVALIISFIVGKTATAYTVLAVIIIVITVGFIQEYKAERAIDALKTMVTPSSIVIRDGKETEIYTRNIVPGDVIILRTGDRIPADCIILEEKELRVDESMLTGESKDIWKTAAKRGADINYDEPSKNLDINNVRSPEHMIFMGTFITSGKCTAKAIHTGMNTKFGTIANMISTAEKVLPLQLKVNKIIKYMVLLGGSMSLLVGIIMLLNSAPVNYLMVIEALIVVLALAIASFPEGFPVVLITTLAFGAFKMAQKNAIINRMSIIETLGETTVICSDKTGTITTGEMTVKKIFVDGKMLDVEGAGYSSEGKITFNGKKFDLEKSVSLNLMIRSAVLCNDSRIERKGEDHEFKIYGSPTEASLLILAAKVGIHIEDMKHSRIGEMPFSSERKMMSVVVSEKDKKVVYSKGAPEVLLKKCKYVLHNNKKILLTEKLSKKIILDIESLTSNSYRAMALAYKEGKSNNINNIEHDFTLIGIVGMEDPPRPEVKDAIQICLSAGITVKMITGDSKETAEAIAKEIGLKGSTISGQEIDALTDDELAKNVDKISIFVRVRPEHKLRIVRALKANGEIVTMTGDGVNDAPALKEAHIGVAMGKNGTDVSREASDLILKDDHFSTIVDAIREGRTIFNNIQKFTVYQISINIAQVMLILLSVMLRMPLPLLAIQILFMNILSDEVNAITLAFNTYSKDVMNQPPRRKSDILTRPLIIFMFVAGLLMTLGAVGIYSIILNVWHSSLPYARTVAFITMNLFAVANAYSFRSFKKPVMTRSLLINKYLFYASIFSIFSTMLIIYTPLNRTFELMPVGLNAWFMAVTLTLAFVIILDTLKILNNRYKLAERLTKISV